MSFHSHLPTLSDGVVSTATLWLTTLFALTFIWALSCIVYRLYLHPLAHLPGPLLWRISNFSRAYLAATGRFASTLHEAHELYGDAVRIGPDDVSIVAPGEVKTIYGHRSEFIKGPFYQTWGMPSVNHFSDRDPTSHAARRRAVASAYSMHSLLNLEIFCDGCTERILSLLRRYDGQQIDLAKFISFYTFDGVGELSFGKSFGLLELGCDQLGLLNSLSNTTVALVAASCFNKIGWLATWGPIAYLTGLLLGDKGPTLFTNIATKLVQERVLLSQAGSELESRNDMLHHFFKAKGLNGNEKMTFVEILTEATVPVIAGSDTTATSMSAFLGYVYTNPETLAKLRKEIAEAHSTGRLDFPITYAQASKLEFLQACIKEACRLHPAVAIMQRVVPAGGREIAGNYYPGGTYIGLSPYEIHRDKRAYGDDADDWRPERWMEGNQNDLEKYNLTFGAGARICIGRNIALIQMTKLLPTLVYNYDFEFQNMLQPFKHYEHWFNLCYEGLCIVRKCLGDGA